jgi:phosphoribosylanthranilate isomerase
MRKELPEANARSKRSRTRTIDQSGCGGTGGMLAFCFPLSAMRSNFSVAAMSLMVKICGITRLEDARVAVDAGADALGFMFYEPSKRFVKPENAARIIAGVAASVDRVGVFVNADEDTVRCAIEVSGINVIQLHGEEVPGFCEKFGPLKIWKAFRVENEESLAGVRRFNNVDAWLLDSYVKGSHGGTGETFNWDLAIKAKENGRPIILAGGLVPENIGEAVRKVRPYGVDVSSGVESAPGIKDAGKIRAFIRAAKAAL